jgi:DedD protein
MNESALRDVERWKDQIEVKLDNRQVFFLFFGSAVVACMLFVLGVIVGKRIESRGRGDSLEVQDPLAALDRVHQPPSVAGPVAPPAELTFQKALSAAPGKSALASLPRTTTPKPLAMAPKPVATTPKPLAMAPKPVAVPKALALAAPPKPAALPAASRPAAEAAKVKGKYTLQLSAFATREEAEAFAQKFDGTFIVPTEVPGKGTWFRVRCGNFGTYQEATAAKTSFERDNKVIALVSAR